MLFKLLTQVPAFENLNLNFVVLTIRLPIPDEF